MALTQENRLIAIDTPLGKDVLLLQGFTGQEGISQLYTFELDLLSDDPNIKFEDIIGQRVTLSVALENDEERFFNGFINRFVQSGRDQRFTHYRATMVPWLWFLTRTADCRIFQKMAVPDIIEKIFSDLGFSDYKLSLSGSYEPRDYCVQYRETDFNFVSRLMEQYGIFYFFEHDDKKHTLVLADGTSTHQPCPKQTKARWEPQGHTKLEEEVISSLQMEKEFRPGKYALTDYNFETPSTSLAAEVKTTIDVGDNGKYEIYDFPGEYGNKGQGDSVVKLRMEEEEAQHFTITGAGNCRAFTSGYRFTLEEHFRDDLNNKDFVLTELQHSATVGDAYTSGSDADHDYSNSFTCIPHTVPFRPSQVTPKPVIQGPQTAVVVGPKGEEIYVDKYSRVKVQFHWDREGKQDENSSCWVRVSQNWAGKQWGAIFIPRIGQEVIVEFLEGDPDRPIITGRVYNAELMPPYDLPANMTQSGLKSRSSKGGSPDNFNEIRFEDKAGSEEVYIHAEKDELIVVENDKNELVGHDETREIKNNRDETIGVNHTEKIGASMTLTVGSSKTETVSLSSTETIGAAKALSIGGAYQISVGAAMNETVAGLKGEQVGGAKTEAVGGYKSEKIGGSKDFSTGKDLSESVGGKYTLKVDKDSSEQILGKSDVSVKKVYSLQSSDKIMIQAADEMLLKTGKASILMKKSGDVVIEAKNFTVKASGDIKLKGKKIMEN